MASKIEFRRNHSMPLRGTALRRRGIVLLIAVFALTAFAFLLPMPGPQKTMIVPDKAEPPQIIEILFLENNLFSVAGDTTDYDNLASVLMKKVQSSNAKEKEFLMTLPRDKTLKDFNEVIRLVEAFEGTTLRLK